MVEGGSVALGLQSVMREFGIETTIDLNSDASAAVSIASRSGLGKVRHIEVCQLWLQDKVKQGRIKVMKVSGEDNVADTMTKHVGREIMCKHLLDTGQETSNDRHALAPSAER